MMSSLGGTKPYRKLYNSIVDTVLVYGLDENYRSLDIDNNEEGKIQDVFEKLLVRDIKPQFLQVLAPGVVHPSRTTAKIDPTVGATPTGDRNPMLGEGISKKFRMEDLGLAWETVETLQHFIYPDGCQLYSTEVEPSCVPVLLTDIYGYRTYAMSIKFTRAFFIEKPSDGGCGHYNLIPATDTGCPSNCKLIYAPTSIVLVSKRPYFKLMKESLSGLYRLLSEEDKESLFWNTIENVAEKLFLLPCLPEGMLSLEVTLPGFSSSTIIMPPRGDLHLDIRLNYPFLCLSVDNVLMVIAALLCEQTLVFTSANYSLPALVIQCFLSYIAPFEWRHSIVPTVPDDFIDMLGAPSINIMGCHANWQDSPEFDNVDDAVIVKLDEDIVESRLAVPAFPELPEADKQRFKLQYQQILEGDYDIDSLERLVLPSAVEREKTRHNFEHYKDTTLSALFLELMVRIFDSVAENLKKSRAVFEEHVKTLPEKDQYFYKYATQTDMFSLFISSRRIGTRDNFSVLADQIKRYLRPQRNSDGLEMSVAASLPINPLTRRSRGSIVSTILSQKKSHSSPSLSITPSLNRMPTFYDDKTAPFISWSYSKTGYFKEIQALELPSFENKPVDRDNYIDLVLTILTEMMGDKFLQPNCMYLTGYYMIAKGHVLEGLEILCCDLKRLNSNIVPPHQERLEFVSLLNPYEKEVLQQKGFYKDMVPARTTGMQSGHHEAGLLRPTRRKSFLHNDFSKEIKHENITKDPESASNLFSILQSVGHSASVRTDIYHTFLDCWKQVVQEIESSSSSYKPQEPLQGVKERIITINSNLRTNVGAHCQVVLTTHRLIIMSNAGMKERVFGVLPEMTSASFCKCELPLYSFVGPKIPIIKLDCIDNPQAPPVTQRTGRFANPKKAGDPYIGFVNSDMRDLWYRIMKEIIAGWQMVTARKDPNVMDSVESHVKIMLALFKTSWWNEVDNSVKHKWGQKILSLQSKPVKHDTKATEALQYRINPNIYNIEKATIESTLFVPSTIGGGEGKLWLGLGNGCLRVYDIEARCFDSDLKIVDARRGKTVRVSCLLLVEHHVWVGSLNKTIHILDVETLCHVSQLSNLEDEPRDLALSKTEPLIVWSLLLNGTILGFDPETRERTAKIVIPNMTQHSFCTCFTVWREFLWVGTNRGTIAVLNSLNRSCVEEISFPGNNRTVEIKYLAVSSEDEIWCSVHSFPRTQESTFISVFNPHNIMRIYTYTKLDSNHRVSFILPVKNTVWCGTKSGQIYVFSARTENNREGPKILDAHDDKVRSMTFTDNDLVISGSGSNDGYANVWRLMNWFGED